MKWKQYILILIWGCLILLGLYKLHNYSLTPGFQGQITKKWPLFVSIEPAKTNTVLLFAHPQCSCTRATFNEFKKVLARTQNIEKECYIVFYKPTTFDEGWLHSGLWETATHMDNVTILTDENGEIAKEFGVTTSGHVMVYDNNNVLTFSGGITSSRAHEGDNTSENELIELLLYKKSVSSFHKTYGCSMFNHEELVDSISTPK